MGNYEDFEFRRFTTKSECDKAINTLNGILLGIEMDHVINDLELAELSNWCAKHNALISRNPFMEFSKRINEAIEDETSRVGLVGELIDLCKKFQEDYIYYGVVTMDLQILQGILHGIISDGVINDDEVHALHQWIDDVDYLKSHYPYDELHGVIHSILEDGVIDDQERKMLLAYFNEFSSVVSPDIARRIREEVGDIRISGIFAVDPEIEIPGRSFCFTGKSKIGSKAAIREMICENKGIWHENLLSNTDYLVVGSDGNPAWAFSCYGGKVETAISMQKNIKNPGRIVILDEGDFARHVDCLKG